MDADNHQGDFLRVKQHKLDRLRSVLRTDLPHTETEMHFDFLTEELRRHFNITETDNISAHGYDPIALELIERCRDGLVLDCGAGKRDQLFYCQHENVVNFEIVPYETTDVLGVGEALPFLDSVFDGVLSLNVLEHVKDPFRCAQEIVRVLRPGGRLYCVVPFLQPLHAYPHHYYNMSMQGLRNLFLDLQVETSFVPASGLPVWALTWIVQRWASELPEPARSEFLHLRLADLLRNPMELLDASWVRTIPPEQNIELACTTALIATKPVGT